MPSTLNSNLLIIGTSLSGPFLEPTPVTKATAEKIFGSCIDSNGIRNTTSLIPAFNQALDLGCNDIRLMRIDASPSNKNGQFKALSAAYSALQNYVVDLVVPTDVYANDVLTDGSQNFALQLAAFCSSLSTKNNITLGFIPVKPPIDTGVLGLQAYVDDLCKYNNNYSLNGNDIGQFISVVAGPEPIHYMPSIGNYLGNSAVAYAAFSSNFNAYLENKSLNGVKDLAFKFSLDELASIRTNNIVAFKKTGSLICLNNPITAAAKGSVYQNLTSILILKEVISRISKIITPFIGEGILAYEKTAVAFTVAKELKALKMENFITDYAYSIKINETSELNVEITIVPIKDTNEITALISLVP
ncbi:hypothetical protein KYB31_06710 [Clostridium felsineum]|uniref:hypothetical protein n=1 Tax=Clostridium felsineum TaxID=36839 RepID=UPI00214D4C49|nr:hypothetical protein [Clostridium felsineum]MCR3758686.1 hypothetical protein [Clostridium felsineum]